MSCGVRPFVKKWDKPKVIPVIKKSRYEKKDTSAKLHWKNAIKELELSCKDEKFWDSQCETVRGLVDPITFYKLAKIFDLPLETSKYEPPSEISSLEPSEVYYNTRSSAEPRTRAVFSISDFEPSIEEELVEEEQSEEWSELSGSDILRQSKSVNPSIVKSRSKSIGSRIMKSIQSAKSASRHMSKSFSKYMSKSFSSRSKSIKSELTSLDETAYTNDDLDVLLSKHKRPLFRHRHGKNPHFVMLYCNESETDMIKWNSKYKPKKIQVSSSDEFNKKAEIMSKQIANEFYKWWVDLGNLEFKSEIKRPEDIEALFQVWFDEHASRGIMLDPKILPCVLKSITDYVGVPKTSCPKVLDRLIAWDIHAETSPPHVMAFGSGLPTKMKHIPPKNNTKEQWHCVKIPEDLLSMATVWQEVLHLTSTKAFHNWLKMRPHLPMPPILKALDVHSDKKQLFVVPSDFVLKDKTSITSSAPDLALPVSQFSLELKTVLSKLLNE